MGSPGSPGLSAYQVAVNNGFVGTEAEWLTSLVGAQGPQGIQGVPGNAGTQGIQGVPGADSTVPGPQGIQGVPGNAGAQGIQGVPGADSTVPGPQGTQGIQGVPGVVSQFFLPIAVPVLAALSWTNQPAALSFWLSTATVAKDTVRVDLTGYTQVRLLVNKQGVAGAAAAKLILRYKASPYTQVVENYSDIGTSEVSVAINVQNTYLDTGWKNIVAGAKADVFVSLLGSGGDGVIDPAFGSVYAMFK